MKKPSPAPETPAAAPWWKWSKKAIVVRLALAAVLLGSLHAFGIGPGSGPPGNQGTTGGEIPEIDPAGVATGIALLTGLVLLMTDRVRGRRRRDYQRSCGPCGTGIANSAPVHGAAS